MIAITGAGGFIGSVLVGYLNQQGITDLVLFDDLPHGDQFKNLNGKSFVSLHSADEMFEAADDIECVIHLGADSNTLEKDWTSLYQSNVLSTRQWNHFCKVNGIPFIFASSAAVYGNGNGPCNHYAFSKWLSENEIEAAALRLFNVYGPNEYHKGRMASVIYHWHNQINETGKVKIFENSRSYLRDFVWVEDVARIIFHFIKNYQPGTYDVGTGITADFETVADLVCSNMRKGSKEFIVMPSDLKDQYQTLTRADTAKLKESGFDITTMLSVHKGIPKYIEYLRTGSFY